MHYCVKCGTRLSDEVKFCTKCGSPQKIAGNHDSIREKNNYNNEYTQVIPKIREVPNRIEQEKKYNHSNEGALKSVMTGVLIGLIILVVGFGSYYFYSKNDVSSKPQTSTTNTVGNSSNTSTDENSTSGGSESTDKSKDNSKDKNNAANTNSKSDEYMLSNSGSTKLTDDQVSSLSKENLAIARNEIYARHGFVFQTEPFKTYFNNKTWYKPNSDFKGSDEELSSVEKANVDLILKYENK